MYGKLLVPVDLAHADRLSKALQVAADLARRYDATIVYLGVTEEAPGAVARNPQEYAGKLTAFAAEQARAHGIATQALPVTSHDPAVEVQKLVLKAVKDSGADLVVMASHAPGPIDWFLSSRAGHVAEHAGISVFVVR